MIPAWVLVALCGQCGSLKEFLGTAFLQIYTVNMLYLQMNATNGRSSLKVSDKA